MENKNEMNTMDYIEIAEELEERGKGLKEYIGHIENELKLAQENYANNMAEYETMAETALEWQRKGITPSLQAWYDEKACEKEAYKKQPLFPKEDVDRLQRILTEKGLEESRLYRQVLREDLEDLLEGIRKHKGLHNDTKRQFLKIAAASRYTPEANLQTTNPEEEAAILRLRFAIEDALQNLQG